MCEDSVSSHIFSYLSIYFHIFAYLRISSHILAYRRISLHISSHISSLTCAHFWDGLESISDSAKKGCVFFLQQALGLRYTAMARGAMQGDAKIAPKDSLFGQL